MAKSEPKTMRFETDVEAFIMKAQGENFSEKFHNLVYWIKDRETKQKAKIAQLDKEIADKQNRLNDLYNKLNEISWLENSFQNLKRALEQANASVSKLINKTTLKDQDENDYHNNL